MAPSNKKDDDFVLTLSDDENIPDEEEYPEEIEEEAPAAKTKKGKNKKAKANAQPDNNVQKRKRADDGEDEDDGVASDFDFELEDPGAESMREFDAWGLGAGAQQHQGAAATSKHGGPLIDVDAIVARRQGKRRKVDEPEQQKDASDSEEEEEVLGEDDEDDEMLAGDGFGMGATGEDEEDEEGSEGEGDEEGSDEGSDEEEEEDENTAAPVAHPDDQGSDDEQEEKEDAAEIAKRNAFFAPESNMEGDKGPTSKTDAAFHTMALSRPILKGLSSIGFGSPTPIQAKAIPVALLGKDVVGGAQTGSGKTGAFLIPILERLLYRPKKVATTRVAILMPTRELALQCFNVAKKLAAFTDITFGQAIGGLNSREQEKELKKRPDIVIATPGRFIDFMRNSSSFAVDTIEIMVLDEADRMLEEGFADELNEILSTLPKSRQTMLFSATMTSKVDDLIRVGLQRPVRLMVDSQKSTVEGLVQEFVRLRPGREQKRLGYLLHICENIHTTRCIIFFRQKKEAHRVRIVFALCGLKAAELHGSMSQEQRIQAIESFRAGTASFLLATDVASRGLDIKGVDSVINYEAPQSHEIYLHRVGRTARAGRTGRSCTLAAEPDRKVVKAAVKAARSQGAIIRQRTIEAKDADACFKRVEALDDEVEAVMREEKEEKALQATERDLTRSENIVKHQDEIASRPKKTWFQSGQDKESARDRGRMALNGPEASKAKRDAQKKGKLSNKEKKRLQDRDDRQDGNEWRKSKADARAAVGKGPRKGGKK
ncbi:hypothetical protein Q7P37_010829 [Cladosporium fusiforme]